MAPENAATRALLMDAVEALMREQGYAVVSARTVAARAGLKYPTVFYYFETMDDLLIATYRRRLQSSEERTMRALESDRPLHALWSAASDPYDAALSLEYIAMSNHNELIRAETIRGGEGLRRLVVDKLSDRLRQASPNPNVYRPFGITVGLTILGGILGFESALGLSGGHEELEDIIQEFLRMLEPGPSTGDDAQSP
jgi:AcrR family transcriptional regulator